MTIARGEAQSTRRGNSENAIHRCINLSWSVRKLRDYITQAGSMILYKIDPHATRESVALDIVLDCISAAEDVERARFACDIMQISPM